MKTKTTTLLVTALFAAPWAADAQQPAPRTAPDQAPGVRTGQPVVNLPGPIDSPQDILESARMAFLMVDADGDGLISQEEATSAGHLLVGGLFFRADADGDGVVTREEAEQVRQQILQQKPILRFVADRAGRDNTPEGDSSQAGTSPEQAAQAFWNLLDGNNDGQLQASELRKAVQTGVEGLFTAADSNRDGQLSPAELNAAMYGAAQAMLQVPFQAADKDNSNSLSKEEFAEAIVQPAYTVFDILDRDLDGQLTMQELETAARIALRELDRLQIDVPRNSPANVIGSGRLPSGTGLNAPTAIQPGRAPQAQPLQPGQPVAPPRF